MNTSQGNPRSTTIDNPFDQRLAHCGTCRAPWRTCDNGAVCRRIAVARSRARVRARPGRGRSPPDSHPGRGRGCPARFHPPARIPRKSLGPSFLLTLDEVPLGAALNWFSTVYPWATPFGVCAGEPHHQDELSFAHFTPGMIRRRQAAALGRNSETATPCSVTIPFPTHRLTKARLGYSPILRRTAREDRRGGRQSNDPTRPGVAIVCLQCPISSQQPGQPRTEKTATRRCKTREVPAAPVGRETRLPPEAARRKHVHSRLARAQSLARRPAQSAPTPGSSVQSI